MQTHLTSNLPDLSDWASRHRFKVFIDLECEPLLLTPCDNHPLFSQLFHINHDVIVLGFIQSRVQYGAGILGDILNFA